MDHFSDARKRRNELSADKSYINEIRIKGAQKAREVGSQVLQKVRKAVGVA